MSENKTREYRYPVYAIIGVMAAIIYFAYGSRYVNGAFGRIYGSVISEIILLVIAFVLTFISKDKALSIIPHAKNGLHGIISSAGMYISALCIGSAFMLTLQIFSSGSAADADAVINEAIRGENPVISIICVALIPAVCEEIFFRGFLLNNIKRYCNMCTSIVVVGAVFSAMHFSIQSFIPTMLYGTLFAYITYSRGSLIIPFILHFVNNTLAVISAYIADDSINANMGKVYTLGSVLMYIGVGTAFGYFSLLSFNGKVPKKKTAYIVTAVSAVIIITAGIIRNI